MNPILPQHYYIPDVEARQWRDGRIYLYGSFDISGNTDYCCEKYHVFSSKDMKNWHDHGPSFDTSICHSKGAHRLFAPDCFEKSGTYYLLYCGDNGSEGIAASSTPAGPFQDARPIKGADGDGIDPAAFVDDDGSVYYFWGQFKLRGARLKPDLCTIDKATLQPELLTESAHGFHEGASIRKRDGIYYMLYTDISRGRATSLAYATSDHPLGPYHKQGIILDNTGCDPETWNNHGSMACFNGSWYLFYHRSSQASRYNRRVCVEPLHFKSDGSIDEIEMTTQGTSAPLPANTKLDAFRTCRIEGGAYTLPLFPDQPTNDYPEILTWTHNGDSAAYKYLNFTDGLRRFSATVASATGGGTIEVRIGAADGTLLCSCNIPNTGGWRIWAEIEAELLQDITGIHALYLVFKGGVGRLVDIMDFCFKQ